MHDHYLFLHPVSSKPKCVMSYTINKTGLKSNGFQSRLHSQPSEVGLFFLGVFQAQLVGNEFSQVVFQTFFWDSLERKHVRHINFCGGMLQEHEG